MPPPPHTLFHVCSHVMYVGLFFCRQATMRRRVILGYASALVGTERAFPGLSNATLTTYALLSRPAAVLSAAMQLITCR